MEIDRNIIAEKSDVGIQCPSVVDVGSQVIDESCEESRRKIDSLGVRISQAREQSKQDRKKMVQNWGKEIVDHEKTETFRRLFAFFHESEIQEECSSESFYVAIQELLDKREKIRGKNIYPLQEMADMYLAPIVKRVGNISYEAIKGVDPVLVYEKLGAVVVVAILMQEFLRQQEKNYDEIIFNTRNSDNFCDFAGKNGYFIGSRASSVRNFKDIHTAGCVQPSYDAGDYVWFGKGFFGTELNIVAKRALGGFLGFFPGKMSHIVKRKVEIIPFALPSSSKEITSLNQAIERDMFTMALNKILSDQSLISKEQVVKLLHSVRVVQSILSKILGGFEHMAYKGTINIAPLGMRVYSQGIESQIASRDYDKVKIRGLILSSIILALILLYQNNPDFSKFIHSNIESIRSLMHYGTDRDILKKLGCSDDQTSQLLKICSQLKIGYL